MNYKKNNSPYSAAITGCAFLLLEYERILPLMMQPDAERLLNEEVENNEILQVNSREGTSGTGAIETISQQLKAELPGLRGFSATSIKNMR